MRSYGNTTPAGPTHVGHVKLPTTPRHTEHIDPFDLVEQGRQRQRTRGIILLNPTPTPEPAPAPKPKPKPRKTTPQPKYDGPPRKPGPNSAPAPANTLSWDVTEAATLARDGWTATQLATKYDVTPETIRYQMKRRGVPLVNMRNKNRVDHHAMATLAAEGKTTTQIATILGCSRKTVWRSLTERRTPFVDGRTTNGTNQPLRDLLAANNTTPADVRTWARDTDHHCPPTGLPPRALIETYLLTTNRTTRTERHTA